MEKRLRGKEREKEIIYRQKIKSNFREIENLRKRIIILKQQIDKLSSGVNIQEWGRHHKGLKAEKNNSINTNSNFTQWLL